MVTNGKWEKLYEALERVYSEYGPSVISEPRKVRSLILDFAPMATIEAKAFASVLSAQEIKRYILNNGDIHVEYLVSMIEDNMGLSTEWAEKIAVGLLILTGKTTGKSSRFIDDGASDSLNTSTIATSVVTKTKTANTQSYEQRLISSGYSRLNNKLWDRAREDFEIALRTSSYPRAYVGLMMSTLHIRVEKEIPLCDSAIEEDPNWKEAMKYATGSYKDKLQRYAREHRRIIDEKKKKTESSKSEKTVISGNEKSTINQITKTFTKQTNTKQDKNSISVVGIILFFLGLTVVLASFVFGIYGWFANTGLPRLLYYLIVTGGSVSGLLMTCFDEFRSTKKDVVDSLWFVAVFGIAVPVVVTIIGLIVNLIIWIINLI